MFSSSLRQQRFWKQLGPALGASRLASFKESPMTSHDLLIPVQTAAQKSMTVRVLLLEGQDVKTGAATKRLQTLSTAVRSTNSIELIVVIHNQEEGEDGHFIILQFQNMLLEYNFSHTFHVPSVDELVPTLETFIAKLKEPSQAVLAKPIPTSQLMAHATATAPTKLLSPQEANALNTLFPTIRDLEEGTRTKEGQAKIYQCLQAKTAEKVIEFWEDEYIA